MFWSKIPFSDVDELDKRAVRIIVPVHGLIDLCVLFDSLIKVLLGFVFIHTDIVRAVKFHLSYRVIDDFRVVALAFDEEEFKSVFFGELPKKLSRRSFHICSVINRHLSVVFVKPALDIFQRRFSPFEPQFKSFFVVVVEEIRIVHDC